MMKNKSYNKSKFLDGSIDVNCPSQKPKQKFFSAGPTVKPADWDINSINLSLLGRSHRSFDAVEFINNVIAKTKKTLGIPDDYLVGVLTGSATCAIESLIWNLLGKRDKGVDAFSHDVFSRRWNDELCLLLQGREGVDVKIHEPIKYGVAPDLSLSAKNRDGIFNFNGSTTGVSFEGVKIPEKDQDSLWICDVTSAVFAMDIPWSDLDAVAFSWQKALGAEPGHGMIALSPKAVDRINNYKPGWVIPTILNLRSSGCDKINQGIFAGRPVNTPSLLCLAEYDYSLDLYNKKGGLKWATERCRENKSAALDWLASNQDKGFYALADNRYQSSSVICFTHENIRSLERAEGWQAVRGIVKKLSDMDIVFDVNNHINEKEPSFRIWLGPNIQTTDIPVVMDWIKCFIVN